MKASPQSATARGDYRYNDQLDDQSLAEVEREHATDQKFLARLKAISTTGFAEQDIVSHELLVRILEKRNESYAFKDFEMPVSQITARTPTWRICPFLPVRQRSSITRTTLHGCTKSRAVFSQTEEVLRAGMKDHLMPVRFLLEKIPGQCQGIIAAGSVSAAYQKVSPASISAADQQRLTQQITDTVQP